MTDLPKILKDAPHILKDVPYVIEHYSITNVTEYVYYATLTVAFDDQNRIMTWDFAKTIPKDESLYILPHGKYRVLRRLLYDDDIVYMNGQKLENLSKVPHYTFIQSYVTILNPCNPQDNSQKLYIPPDSYAKPQRRGLFFPTKMKCISRFSYMWFPTVHYFKQGRLAKTFKNLADCAREFSFTDLEKLHKECLEYLPSNSTFFRYAFYENLSKYIKYEADSYSDYTLPIIFQMNNVTVEIPNIFKLGEILGIDSIDRLQSMPIPAVSILNSKFFYKFYIDKSDEVYDIDIYEANLAFEIMTGKTCYKLRQKTIISAAHLLPEKYHDLYEIKFKSNPYFISITDKKDFVGMCDKFVVYNSLYN